MGAWIPTERMALAAAERHAAAARTQRVCAWCGAVEPAAEGAGSATTHGLCRSCLEKRMAEEATGDAEPPSDSDPEAGDPREACD